MSGATSLGVAAPQLLTRKSVCDLRQLHKKQSNDECGNNNDKGPVSPRLSVASAKPRLVEVTHSGHMRLLSKHDAQLKSTDSFAVLSAMLHGDAAHSRRSVVEAPSGIALSRSKSGLALDIPPEALAAKRPSLLRLDTSPAALTSVTGDARRRSSLLSPPPQPTSINTESIATSSATPERRRSVTVSSAFGSPLLDNNSLLPSSAAASRRSSITSSRRGSSVASESRRVSVVLPPVLAATIDSRRPSSTIQLPTLASRRSSTFPALAAAVDSAAGSRSSLLPPDTEKRRRSSFMLLQETPGVTAAKAFFSSAIGRSPSSAGVSAGSSATDIPVVFVSDDEGDQQSAFSSITVNVSGDDTSGDEDDDDDDLTQLNPPPVRFRRGSTIPLAAISAASDASKAKSRSLVTLVPIPQVATLEGKGAREIWKLAISAVLSTQTIQRTLENQVVPGDAAPAIKGKEYSQQKWNHDEVMFLTRQLALNKPIVDFIQRRDRGRVVGTDRVCEFLRRLMPFKKFNDQQLEKLARCIRYEQHAKDRMVLRQGHIPSNVYVVLSGEVHVVVQKSKDDPGAVVNSIKAGQGFGELAILRRTTRMSTIRCAMWSEFLVVPKDDYISILADDPLTSGTTTIAIMDQLGKIPMFHGLPEEALIKLAMSAEINEYKPGQVVVKEDELANRSLYFVLQGFVSANKNLPASKKRTETTFEVCKLADNDFFPSLRIHKQTLNEAFLEEFGVYFNLLNTGLDERNNVTEKFRRAYSDKTANVTVKAKTNLIVLRCQRLEFLRIINDDIYTEVRRKGYVMEVTEDDLEKQYERSENWTKYKKAVLTEVGWKRKVL